MANNVLFFVREIDDIEENIKSNVNLAKKFIEIDKNNEIDESARTLLDDLKYKKIPAKLPESNIFKFNVVISFFFCLKNCLSIRKIIP